MFMYDILFNDNSFKCRYIQDSNLATTAPVDSLAPNGARPSAGTVLNEGLDLFTYKFFWWSTIPYDIHVYGDVIPNGRRGREKSRAFRVIIMV